MNKIGSLARKMLGFASEYWGIAVLAAITIVPSHAACTASVTTPAASASISGLSYALTASLSSCPTALSLEWMIDGESQGVVWSAPWSIPSWNTNNRYNGPAHVAWVIVRDPTGA